MFPQEIAVLAGAEDDTVADSEAGESGIGGDAVGKRYQAGESETGFEDLQGFALFPCHHLPDERLPSYLAIRHPWGSGMLCNPVSYAADG